MWLPESELCIRVLGQAGTVAEKVKKLEYLLKDFRLYWAMGSPWRTLSIEDLLISWFSGDGSFCMQLLAVLATLCGREISLFFLSFQGSRLKEKDLILLFPFIQVGYSVCHFLSLPFDACVRGSCILGSFCWHLGQVVDSYDLMTILSGELDGIGSKLSSLSVGWKLKKV